MKREDPEVRSAFDRERFLAAQKCEQCGQPMGYEFFLGSVCGKCCKANHKKVTGRK
jgi:hypothetical protein